MRQGEDNAAALAGVGGCVGFPEVSPKPFNLPRLITDHCTAEFGGVEHGPIPSLRDADHPANALFGPINKTLC